MQTRRWWIKSYKKVSFMDAGIKIKDVVVGTGDIAQRAQNGALCGRETKLFFRPAQPCGVCSGDVQQDIGVEKAAAHSSARVKFITWAEWCPCGQHPVLS